MLPPVKLYGGKDSDLRNASPEEPAALANYFTATLHEELGKDYRIVSSPGPDVMIIRTAITDADESEVLLDTVVAVASASGPCALSRKKRKRPKDCGDGGCGCKNK